MQVPDPGCSGIPKTAKAVPDPAPLHRGRGSRRADSSQDEAGAVALVSKDTNSHLSGKIIDKISMFVVIPPREPTPHSFLK